MPIPEPGRYRPAVLYHGSKPATKEQRQAQLAVCYGVSMTPEFTEAEVQRMREIVQAHDQQKPIRTIDLNNPPKEPYRFQKFPMCLYAIDRGKRVILTVHSEEQLEEALSDGWTQEPPVIEEEQDEEDLSAPLQMEADRVQKQLEASRRKKKGKAA